MTLQGRVEKTFVRGQLVWDAGKPDGDLQPLGQLL